MKRKIFSILFALVLVLGLGLIPVQTSTVEANGPAVGDVEVTVYEQDGTTAISGAEVGLFWGAPAWKWMDEETTDASGKATFTKDEIAAFGVAEGFTPTTAKFQVYAGASGTYGNVFTWDKDTEMPCITYDDSFAYAFSYNLVMLLQQSPEMSYDNDTKELTVTYTLAEKLSTDWLSDKTAKIGLFMGPYAEDPYTSGVFQGFPDGPGGWSKYWLMPFGYKTPTIVDIDDATTISAKFDLDAILGEACNMECGDTVIAVPFFVADRTCDQKCTNCGDFYGLVESSNFEYLIMMEDAGAALLEPTTINPATVKPGDNVLVKWFFHADCETSQDFYIEIYKGATKISPDITSTVSGTTICDCFIGESLVPISSTASEGSYDLKIRSLCNACPAVDIEVDAVIVDATPPDVVLTSPTTATNLNDCDYLEISGTMYDEGGISNVLLEFSTDSGTTWPITLYDGVPSGVGYDPVDDTFTTEFHVGDTPDEGLVGIDSCLCHVRVTVTDGVGLTASAASGAFIIDNTPPDVDITSPDPEVCVEGVCVDGLLGGTAVDIVFDYSDNCGPVTADIHYQVGTSGWVEIVSGLAMPALSDSYTYPWTVPPTLETCDLYIRVTVKDCPENQDTDEVKTCATAPLIMVDAITGWTWSWEPTDNPVNSNTPTSIMVVFNKKLDLDTVEITDFAVMNPTKAINDMEVHTEETGCGAEWQGWTFVFLTVSPLMKTDEMPTVRLKAGQSVEDETGELILEGLVELVCQDGIAPIVDLTAKPAEPGYNEMVTVTIQGSEKLSEAYLFVGSGSPQDYTWNTCKPIGWPPEHPAEPIEWTEGDWLVMEEGTLNKWTVEFRNTFSPDDNWFVEVAAHDFTEWEVFPWKHEKWTEESIKFHAVEYVKIYLYEGWNLISVPWELTDPSVAGFFGTRFSGVTKAHYYDATRHYWLSAALNPLTGTWSGNITTIEPGKGYWVWCSPPKVQLIMTVVEPDPLVVPPAYNLVKGWNLIGFTALDYPLQYRFMSKYLFSLCDICKLVYWYEAQPQEWNRVTPTADWWPSCKDRAKPGYGYWLYLATAGTLAP